MNLAQLLNDRCLCTTVDEAQLATQWQAQLHAPPLQQTHPHLFCHTQVYVSDRTWRAVRSAVGALERTTRLPAWRQHALHDAPAIAHSDPGALSVFMGFDFHVDESQDAPVRLIEINTNAGGALLSAMLAKAQITCCGSVRKSLEPATALSELETRLVAMFQNEWHLHQVATLPAHARPLRSIAIVDTDPLRQYLAPEFALFQALFAGRGLLAWVLEPSELHWDGQRLMAHTSRGLQPIDLVYNRLTDFDLSGPGHVALRAAYEARAVALTPHPHAHAVQANKRHLVTLSDTALLASMGVPQNDLELLRKVVPASQMLTPDNADTLWAARKGLFFKPLAGYAGKAAYRGDKLTLKTWATLTQGGFIAQAMVPPGRRVVGSGGAPQPLKFDLRAYAYEGQVQHLVARTYQGQTTNMQTPGGGFASVVVVPDNDPACPCARPD